MEVNAKIIQFPIRPVPEAEFYHRARRAALALARGNTDIGPLYLYGPHKERLALMQWAVRGRQR